jgi:hypothetical protein
MASAMSRAGPMPRRARDRGPPWLTRLVIDAAHAARRVVGGEDSRARAARMTHAMRAANFAAA